MECTHFILFLLWNLSSGLGAKARALQPWGMWAQVPPRGILVWGRGPRDIGTTADLHQKSNVYLWWISFVSFFNEFYAWEKLPKVQLQLHASNVRPFADARPEEGRIWTVRSSSKSQKAKLGVRPLTKWTDCVDKENILCVRTCNSRLHDINLQNIYILQNFFF